MTAKLPWFDALARKCRLFFFQNDVLRSSRFRGDYRTIQRIYKVFAPVYDWIFPRFTSFKATADRMIEYCIRPGDTVLDLGAGTGMLAMRMSRKVGRVVAFDLQEKMLEVARRNARKAQVIDRFGFCQGSATTLPFRGQCFDRVVSSFMEVYLDIPDKIRMLEEIHRILRKDGQVAFITGVGELSHRYILKEEWVKILQVSGFGDIHFEEHYDVYRLVVAKKRS